jgi:signal transduction histidine kinase
MNFRRALSLPITLASVMIVLLVVLIVGWVLLAVFGALGDEKRAPFYWTWLLIGTTFLTLVLVGVVMYLVLQIKTLALTARQTNFIDSVTHELKSPIASLKLYLQTLTRHQVSREQEADFFRYMLDDVNRLDHLINHMLEVARVERGAASSDIAEIRLDELLRLCGETVAMRYRVPPETVRIESPVSIIRGSRVDLEMIFRNLIDNAVKYGGSPPEVNVSLKLLPEERALVRVADNGRGIPKKLRRKIFGRFVRLGVELEREKTGTGLGLYIVRTLVRRHGGQIRVVDSPPGVGTVFEVELPGARGEEKMPSGPPALTSLQPAGNR